MTVELTRLVTMTGKDGYVRLDDLRNFLGAVEDMHPSVMARVRVSCTEAGAVSVTYDGSAKL